MGKLLGEYIIGSMKPFIKKDYSPLKIIQLLDSPLTDSNCLGLTWIKDMLLFPKEHEEELKTLYMHIRDSNLPKYTKENYIGSESFDEAKKLLKRWNFELAK